MIYFFTALYPEAAPLIRRLSLQRDPAFAPHRVYRDSDARFTLAVTGTGPVKAAMTAAAVFALLPPEPADLLVNLGICAGIPPVGQIDSRADVSPAGPADSRAGVEPSCSLGRCFLCSSLQSADSGRVFYPDLLWQHPFDEAPLVSGSRILNCPANLPAGLLRPADGLLLYDMEGAALYECASLYLEPHRMIFLKIVSDSGDGHVPTPDQVGQLVDGHADGILPYIESVAAALPGKPVFAQTDCPPEGEMDPSDEAACPSVRQMLLPENQVADDLHCSETMRHTLHQYLTYDALSGGRCRSLIRQLYAEGSLPCKDRKEGKNVLAKLYASLL